jgi:hypothetical protein
MVEAPTLEITPAYGCGFQAYCGFDDWFMVQGGLLLLLVIGALLVKRWRDLPVVAGIAIASPLAASYLIGAPAFMLYDFSGIAFALVIIIATTIAAAVHALKRLALHLLRRKLAPA